MAGINVQRILEAEDGEAALTALKYAREYAQKGMAVELLDLLAPEGARSYVVTDKGGKKRRITS